MIAFGQSVAVETPPSAAAPEAFTQEVGPGASGLAAALDRAAALLPADAPGRVLVLSDGRYTGADPGPAAAALGQRGVAIDTREISRPATGDAAVLRVEAPGRVGPGEAFGVSAWVTTPAAGHVPTTSSSAAAPSSPAASATCPPASPASASATGSPPPAPPATSCG